MAKHLVLIIILSLAGLNGFCQRQDALLWAGISVTKKVTKKMDLSLMEQGRFNNNISNLKNIFTDLSLGYRLNNSFKFSAGYRFANQQLVEGGFETAHRYNIDVQARFKKKPFVVSYRNRFQVESVIKANGVKRDPYDRSRIKVALDLDKKYSPWISTELYYSINLEEFNKVRYTVGVELDLPNRNELALFYRFKNTFNVSSPVNSYIIGVMFSYGLSGRLIKKREENK